MISTFINTLITHCWISLTTPVNRTTVGCRTQYLEMWCTIITIGERRQAQGWIAMRDKIAVDQMDWKTNRTIALRECRLRTLQGSSSRRLKQQPQTKWCEVKAWWRHPTLIWSWRTKRLRELFCSNSSNSKLQINKTTIRFRKLFKVWSCSHRYHQWFNPRLNFQLQLPKVNQQLVNNHR